MSEPTFRLDEDSDKFFWWSHECNYAGFDGLNRHSVRLPLSDRGWKVVSTDPLTVTPSILCGSCGCHGFITAGKWISV